MIVGSSKKLYTRCSVLILPSEPMVMENGEYINICLVALRVYHAVNQ